MPLWLKAAPPVALAAGGVTLALLAPGRTAEAKPDAWVDSPLITNVIPAGAVTVVGHATSTTHLSSIALDVDGKQVAVDDHPEGASTLIKGTFTWQATPGEHVLVVRSGSIRSREDHVVVANPDGTAPSPTPGTTTAPTTTASPTPSPTASPTPSATPSPTESPTAAPTTAAPTTPPPTHSPTPRPTHTTTPAPSISSASVSPTFIATQDCGDGSGTTATVHVSAQHATSYTVTFSAGGHGTKTVTFTGSSTTVTASQLEGADDGSGETNGIGSRGYTGREWTVTVKATGPGGSTTRSAGTLDVGYSCFKP